MSGVSTSPETAFGKRSKKKKGIRTAEESFSVVNLSGEGGGGGMLRPERLMTMRAVEKDFSCVWLRNLRDNR